jgi:hypothetical protein
MLKQPYHDDVVWDVPSRRVIHRGESDVLENHARIFERYAESKVDPSNGMAHLGGCSTTWR